LNVLLSYHLKSGDFDLRDYEVVRAQSFSIANITGLSFTRRGIRFSGACIRNFNGSEMIELLVYPERYQIAVRPCPEQHKRAMRWAKVRDGRISVREISAAAFIKTLYELFGWDIGMRYRLRGEILRRGGETVAFFDARKPEIFLSRYDVQMPWATGFGENYYRYKNARQISGTISAVFTEYNNEPGLCPTVREDAGAKAQLLIEKLQNGGDSSCDCADILD